MRRDNHQAAQFLAETQQGEHRPEVAVADAVAALFTLLKCGRSIWGGRRGELPYISACMSKINGDLAEQVRTLGEGGQVDWERVGVELLNFVLSAVRFADDLDLDLEQCLAAAVAAQTAYAQRLGTRRG